MKRCYRCGETKTLGEFHRNKGYKDGLAYDCKSCRLEYNRALPKKPSPKRYYDYAKVIQKKYGLSIDEYQAMLDEQNSACAICLRPCTTGRRLSVDHDHDTGKVRGLLCSWCNRYLGHMKDDPDFLERAVDYLRRHKDFTVLPAAVNE